MNPRLHATACCMAISALLLAGCASGPTTSSNAPAPADASAQVDLARLPNMMMPGATPAEVKSLAMGAARSKGWQIAKSAKDRLVAQRPADPQLLAGIAPGLGAPGSTLEFTSFFVPGGGGVNVATQAEVVTPAVAGKPATRTDLTDYYRETLTQSLASLGETWARHRDRLDRAAPPAEGWKSAWDTNPSTSAPSTTSPPPATVASQEPPASSAPKPVAAPRPAAPPSVTPATTYSAQTRPATPSTRPPEPRYAPSTAATSGSSVPIPSYNTRLAPEPKYRPSRAAPVVDASSSLDSRYDANAYGASAPAMATADVASQDNMMAMPETRRSTPVGGSVSWSASAEQYARQRGCQVSSEGAQLIESRQDGEVHKVPCDGSDSFLVRCQNGTCQGLL